MNSPLVKLENITKTFGGNRANDRANLTLYRGETLALLGENGAGKSTLMNCLCGIYRPDEGNIYIEGEKKVFRTPQGAIDAGIGMVHQNFMLVHSMTAWENIALGSPLPFSLPKNEVAAKVAELSETYGLDVDPNKPIWKLSVGEQQRVAILKALYRDAKVLILDEPTAVLTPQEAQSLFITLRHMNDQNRGVIFISHKLDEVMQLAHRVTIMRKGKVTGELVTKETTKEAIAEAMMGQKITFTRRTRTTRLGKELLSLQGACCRDEQNRKLLDDVSLTLHSGEILGLAGVSGNGQMALCEALVGLQPLESGRVLVEREDFTGKMPRQFLDKGFRYIPADRRGTGMVGNMNAIENSALRRYRQGRQFTMDWHGLWQHTKQIIQHYQVDTASEHAPVRNLSGGNLQKLMMGRELSDDHKGIIVMNPTWGLDIAATKFVRDRLLEERERGLGVLLVSEDLDELMQLCDRLLIIYRGEITGEIVEPTAKDLNKIGLLMAGCKEVPNEV